MQNIKIVYLNLVILSASIISFEIISTRISSVIFVSNYAYIILSLAILGLAAGSIYSFYKIKSDSTGSYKLLFNILILSGSAFILFIIAVTVFKLTNPFVYFLLLFAPLFFLGIFYAQIFRHFAVHSFTLYTSDLLGAALGAAVPVFIIDMLGASNSILLIAVLLFALAGIYHIYNSGRKKVTIYYSTVAAVLFLLIVNGRNDFLGKVPVGKYDEKDFYYVYPNAEDISNITESRWSIYGRSDLVQYNDQDMVKQLFIDGAAGSQMYRFNGNINSPDPILYNLLIRHSNTIPFFFLTEQQKNSMLVIGPGGGKDILIGLLGGVKQITGVEINPDFVNIVKDYSDFNGGIYTNFPNVKIETAEGRHFVKKTNRKYDLIVMALPSTKQMQNIEGLAENENYLLTVEAVKDYLNDLTAEGRLIFTVHNKWELMRLIVTAIAAIKETSGGAAENILNHFAVLEADYAPTLVIKKNTFTEAETAGWHNIIKTLPAGLPAVTYLPFSANRSSLVNNFLAGLSSGRYTLEEYIDQHKYNISPCRDDSPYFYKVNKGVPGDLGYLLSGLIVFNIFAVSVPYLRARNKQVKNKSGKNNTGSIRLMAAIFACLGAGFMIIEISLFQKLILFLGSPTISLSILLSSLLIGMGTGSYFGSRIAAGNNLRRLIIAAILVVAAGIVLFFVYPVIVGQLLKYTLYTRAAVSFVIMLPFGFMLGIPFPSSIQMLKSQGNEDLIPWMYGINGTMSVLGSVLAVILSMQFGFTITFFTGLFFYVIIVLITRNQQKSGSPEKISEAAAVRV